MSEARIIAVMGATGAQGGGLVRAILADKQGGFTARAITRNPDSDAAKALKAAGAEVVQGDADKPATLEQAFAGAWGVFCVTNFWEHFSPEREKAQALAQAEAAKKADVKHVVWSSLEDTRRWIPLTDDRMPTLQGNYKVPHFDAKGECDKIFLNMGVPTTVLYTSFYWDNLIHFGMGPKPGPDGTLALTLPMADKPLTGMAAADIGPCAYGIFKRAAAFAGKTVGVAGEHLPVAVMAEKMSRALGRKVVYNEVSPATYRSFGFPGADDLGNMFQYYQEFPDYFAGMRPLEATRALHPGLLDFDAWLAQNKDRIPTA